MKKYYSYIAIALFVLALILYIASFKFAGYRTILMCFGSCAMCFGALLTIQGNRNNKSDD